MDMTAALGTICLAEAVLDVFQQKDCKDCNSGQQPQAT